MLPESLCLLCEWSWVSPVWRLVELRKQSLAGFLTRVVGELHCNGLGGSRRLLSVQPLNGLLSLDTPIEADKTHASRHACAQENTLQIQSIRKIRLHWLENLFNIQSEPHDQEAQEVNSLIKLSDWLTMLAYPQYFYRCHFSSFSNHTCTAPFHDHCQQENISRQIVGGLIS